MDPALLVTLICGGLIVSALSYAVLVFDYFSVYEKKLKTAKYGVFVLGALIGSTPAIIAIMFTTHSPALPIGLLIAQMLILFRISE